MDNATKEKILEIAELCNGCLEGKSLHPSDGCYSCENRGAYYGAKDIIEWKKEKGYLTDTCLSCQDKYKAWLDYFKIEY